MTDCKIQRNVVSTIRVGTAFAMFYSNGGLVLGPYMFGGETDV